MIFDIVVLAFSIVVFVFVTSRIFITNFRINKDLEEIRQIRKENEKRYEALTRRNK